MLGVEPLAVWDACHWPTRPNLKSIKCIGCCAFLVSVSRAPSPVPSAYLLKCLAYYVDAAYAASHSEAEPCHVVTSKPQAPTFSLSARSYKLHIHILQQPRPSNPQVTRKSPYNPPIIINHGVLVSTSAIVRAPLCDDHMLQRSTHLSDPNTDLSVPASPPAPPS